MFYVFGVITAVISIVLSVLHLKQDLGNYYDFVGMIVVLGGTLSVMIMIFPWQMKKEIKTAFGVLFVGKRVDLGLFNQACFGFIQSSGGGGTAKVNRDQDVFAESILADGAELLQLGFSKSKIERILEERIFQWNDRMARVSGAIRSLAKYPPAFGLVGTVLGLVSLMRAISQGTNSSEAGLRMAVALVATLYGLLTANLFLNPAGERVAVHTAEEKKAAEIAMQAVLLAVDSVSLLEAQEVLNSYVRPDQRVDVFGDARTATEGAA